MMEHMDTREIKIAYEPAADRVSILPMNRAVSVDKDAAV